MQNTYDIVVVGGGAAGFMAAISAKTAHPQLRVTILEQGNACLNKVRISGGGRCNVTNAITDHNDCLNYYPRGKSILKAIFCLHSQQDTVNWFSKNNVTLKQEPDGRMFPVSNSSKTIVNCLLQQAAKHNIQVQTQVKVLEIDCQNSDIHIITTTNQIKSSAAILTMGGASNLDSVLKKLHVSFRKWVPSLFALCIKDSWLHQLAGISLTEVSLQISDTQFKTTGNLLLTHHGMSGPAALKLSAWAAEYLHECRYQATIIVDWLPKISEKQLLQELTEYRQKHPKQILKNWQVPLPERFWIEWLQKSKFNLETRSSELGNKQLLKIIEQLKNDALTITEKKTNRDEFVHCGGITDAALNLPQLSLVGYPNVFAAGECLDIDGLTGGFNFQAAWSTGWVAGLNATQYCLTNQVKN